MYGAREIDLSYEHSLITVWSILEKCHDITFGPFSGSYGAFSGIFSTESQTKHHDWLQVRRFGFPGVPDVFHQALTCLGQLSPFSGFQREKVSFDHSSLSGMKLFQDHVIFSRTCFISRWFAWNENCTHSPGTSRCCCKARGASGDDLKFGDHGDGERQCSKILAVSLWSGTRRQGETLTHWQEARCLLQVVNAHLSEFIGVIRIYKVSNPVYLRIHGSSHQNCCRSRQTHRISTSYRHSFCFHKQTHQRCKLK